MGTKNIFNPKIYSSGSSHILEDIAITPTPWLQMKHLVSLYACGGYYSWDVFKKYFSTLVCAKLIHVNVTASCHVWLEIPSVLNVNLPWIM